MMKSEKFNGSYLGKKDLFPNSLYDEVLSLTIPFLSLWGQHSYLINRSSNIFEINSFLGFEYCPECSCRKIFQCNEQCVSQQMKPNGGEVSTKLIDSIPSSVISIRCWQIMPCGPSVACHLFL